MSDKKLDRNSDWNADGFALSHSYTLLSLIENGCYYVDELTKNETLLYKWRFDMKSPPATQHFRLTALHSFTKGWHIRFEFFMEVSNKQAG